MVDCTEQELIEENFTITQTEKKISALWIQKSRFDSFKRVVFLTPGRPLQESYFVFFWVDTCRVILTLLIESFWLYMGSFQSNSWVRIQINSSEVSFYNGLESFRLLFGIKASFQPNVGVKTTIKVETTH